ncbi:MAG: type II secretion system F family protein [Oscillospiraceae bacterium]|jgi:type IV pilus assembly protein PilC|nr:type II secretion system F family protein [Oscillospiraceae bacterium]
MPNFKYRALAPDGSRLNGVIEAYDEFEAVDRLKQNGAIIEAIARVDEQKVGLLQMQIGSQKAKEKELALMCSQFAIVLKAGMPIVRCVELIAGQTSDKLLSKILAEVAEDVAGGYGLAQSFENKGSKELPTSFIETVRAGEESGTLEVSFEKLHTYFDKSSKIKAKVKSAMMYPIFLLVISVIVIAIVLTVAMPVFIDMFVSLNTELPAPTKLLIAVSDFMAAYWWLLAIIIAGGIIALKLWQRTEKGRMAFARFQLKMPILGNVALMKGSSQFANTMATMLTSGLSIVRAVVICSRTLDNYFLSTELAKTAAGLEEGRPLGWCMQRSEIFPDLLVEMTSVGDETGSLEETLTTIGEYYDSETAIASERALNSLQPIITVVLGVVIGFIVISLYLPMFTMYGAM